MPYPILCPPPMRPPPSADTRPYPNYRWLMALPPLQSVSRAYAPERGGAEGQRRQLSILLVEDDAAIADMYRLQLSRDGYRVEIAGDAGAALERIRKSPPDLVLLDILLPGPDGFSVLESMGAGQRPPVVILSNYGDGAMMERGRRLGALDYIVKSRITPADLSRSVPRWIERQGP